MSGAAQAAEASPVLAASDWFRPTVAAALERGDRVVAPRLRDGVMLYGEVDSPGELGLPRTSAPLLSLTDLFLEPKRDNWPGRPILVLGCRPCEAAALRVLDAFFAHGGLNEAYCARRARTTVLAFACTRPDAHCFCTSVGGSPSSRRGVDVLVRRGPGDREWLTPCTERGRALAAEVPHTRRRPPEFQDPTVPQRFDPAAVQAGLASSQGDEPALEVGCVGCGACRLQCLTCHCADGAGAVNWCCARECTSRQCCALSLFPAGDSLQERPRGSRWEVWVRHKFLHFPAAFGILGCVGCGRCVRACGAGVDLVNVLQGIERAAPSGSAAAGQPTVTESV